MKYIRYLQGLGLVALATLAGFLIRPFLHATNLVMLYLAAVVIAAFFLGRGPALLASLVSVLAFDYFLVDPRLSFSVNDTEYLVTFAGLLAVSLVISGLAAQVKEQVRAVEEREALTEALHRLSQDLAVVYGLEKILQTIEQHISMAMKSEVVVLLPEQGNLRLRVATGGQPLSDSDLETAHRIFSSSSSDGTESRAVAASGMRFIPLRGNQGVVGILGVCPQVRSARLDDRQLESFANLAALALERARLAEEANQARLLRETEKLQTALLNSISHDLRTPLVSIQGVLDSLLEAEQGDDQGAILSHAARLDMLDNAREETARLNRLVENLLEMTRLESGSLRLLVDEADIQDILGSALGHLGGAPGEHPVLVKADEDLPPVPVDFVLIEQVLVNLLENASKYSPPGSPIEIELRHKESEMQVSVADRGVGIQPGDGERIFEKFYRSQQAGRVKGTGLGLSICKGIVEAHHGWIRAESRPGGGTRIAFGLPLQVVSDVRERKNHE